MVVLGKDGFLPRMKKVMKSDRIAWFVVAMESGRVRFAKGRESSLSQERRIPRWMLKKCGARSRRRLSRPGEIGAVKFFSAG
jgi:hypothetical protein